MIAHKAVPHRHESNNQEEIIGAANTATHHIYIPLWTPTNKQLLPAGHQAHEQLAHESQCFPHTLICCSAPHIAFF